MNANADVKHTNRLTVSCGAADGSFVVGFFVAGFFVFGGFVGAGLADHPIGYL